MNAKELLIEAKKLIEQPEHWIQNTYGRDKEGDDIGEPKELNNAVCYCSSGALYKTAQMNAISDTPIERMAFASLYDEMGTGVPWFNDHHSHEEVMAAWDHAIENCDV